MNLASVGDMQEIFWIPEIEPLRLGLMAQPRAGGWLADEIAGWHRAGINIVVSLLEAEEVRELGLQEESLLCRQHDIEFVWFPIADRRTPALPREVFVLVEGQAARLRDIRAVGIHCRAGIGRSGTIGACVLIALGVPFAEVFPMLTRARRVPVPDTPEQVEWVRSHGLICSTSALGF